MTLDRLPAPAASIPPNPLTGLIGWLIAILALAIIIPITLVIVFAMIVLLVLATIAVFALSLLSRLKVAILGPAPTPFDRSGREGVRVIRPEEHADRHERDA